MVRRCDRRYSTLGRLLGTYLVRIIMAYSNPDPRSYSISPSNVPTIHTTFPFWNLGPLTPPPDILQLELELGYTS